MPEAFDDSAFLFACGYAVVRIAHIALFALASRDDAALRYSVATLAASTAVGVGLLVAASFTDGVLQGGLWALALLLDMAVPTSSLPKDGGSCQGTSPSVTGS